ncbi:MULTISPECIES: type II secretion system F family protein [Paenibacillus]|uniref:Type II secretion system F family protein n=1 Tax=Paenibacillus polymyxa TaxID=1406 RepID=A0AAP4E8D7_PAEPO|nr:MULTISPECIES: type II secretion system F family protein [Paenibacillus]MBP1175223.1 tight adherence protein C [Paenibacillus sp. PvR133]APB77009.1 type II secretion protein F [Paenibacillus polymyxa]MDH2330137.1 type II secretion system F family protein [Paenibacillus polymyxa]POR30192.1 type II secretion protein F [Paenibacillus polymyxa]SFR01160.1 type II secretion system protein F (GspF) [Paenibacillus sp. cl130]
MVMLVCLVMLVLQVGGWVVLNQMHGAKYAHFRHMKLEGLRLQRLSVPFVHMIHASRATHRLPLLMFKLQRSVQKLYGMRNSGEKTMLFLTEMLGYGYIMAAGGALISLMLGGDATGLVLGLGLGILVPIALIKDLHGKVQKRDQQILMELPELLSKMMLLVGAGETVQRALLHCVERKGADTEHPLYRELRQTVAEWESGYSFQQAFEHLSKRCGIQEMTVFTTTVLLNMRRGGSDFVMALRELSQTLWGKRTSISRTRGEQASSKLVFPMALILLTVIVLVGAPALMMMNM